jgi:hypothetical protein
VEWVDGQVELAEAIFYFGGNVGEYSLTQSATAAGWFVNLNDAGLSDGLKRTPNVSPEYQLFVPIVIR